MSNYDKMKVMQKRFTALIDYKRIKYTITSSPVTLLKRSHNEHDEIKYLGLNCFLIKEFALTPEDEW